VLAPARAVDDLCASWTRCARAQASAAALALFEHGQRAAAQRGLLLVDTKYEFGVAADGRILLVDEIHTPDSSRRAAAPDAQLLLNLCTQACAALRACLRAA